MRHLRLIFLALTAIGTLAATATVTDSLRASITADYCGLWQINSDIYAGPAATNLRPDGSMTTVLTQADYTQGETAWQGWRQRHAHSLAACATTRTRTRGGIATAVAEYRNTAVSSLSGSETLEAPLLYPYLTSDTAGGPLNAETYRFVGSVSDTFGRLTAGIGGSYRAALEYRQTDPRPRNITGDLDINLGAVYALTPAVAAGLDLRAGRYRHSSQISFVNPLGGTVIRHLTGPETHYIRFAGNGLSSLYTGLNYGASLSLLPLRDGLGWTAGVSGDYSTTTKQLVDLNRLPLSRMTVARHSASLTWTGRNASWLLMPYAQWKHERTRGCENIFGDATAGVYPLISSIEMYGCSVSRTSVGLASEWAPKQCGRILVDCRLGQSSFHEMYRKPIYNVSLHSLEWLCNVKAAKSLGPGLVTADIGCGKELRYSHRHIAAGMHWPLSRTLMAYISAKYHNLQNNNNFAASIGLNF